MRTRGYCLLAAILMIAFWAAYITIDHTRSQQNRHDPSIGYDRGQVSPERPKGGSRSTGLGKTPTSKQDDSERYNADKFRTSLASLVANGPSAGNIESIVALLREWARVRPEEALSAVRGSWASFSGTVDLEAVILREWVKYDPANAWLWSKTAEVTPGSEDSTPTGASGDPMRRVIAVLAGLAEYGAFQEAGDLVTREKIPVFSQTNVVGELWAKENLKDAVDWATSISPGIQRVNAIAGIMKSLSGVDAANATELALALPERADKAVALITVVETILRDSGADSALAWLVSNQGNSVFDGARGNFVLKLSGNPENADMIRTVLPQIMNRQTQIDRAATAAQSLLQTKPTEAFEIAVNYVLKGQAEPPKRVLDWARANHDQAVEIVSRNVGAEDEKSRILNTLFGL